MAIELVEWPKLILFGDSHFQHSFGDSSAIGRLIADHYQRRCDVINRGFSGYNTAFANDILPRILFELQPVVSVAGVVVLFGSNDASPAQPVNNQHVPLVEYSANLNFILDALINREIPKEKIVLVSPPPVDAEAWKTACLLQDKISSRDNLQTQKYAAAAMEIAKKREILYVDLFSEMSASSNWEHYFSDGLHLNYEGSKLFFEKLNPVLETLLEGCTCRYPDWKTFDLNNG